MNEEEKQERPRKRLALFFDGTWSIQEDNTNVWRLSMMLADRGEDGMPQAKFYDEGVGTHLLDRFTGVRLATDFPGTSAWAIAG